MSHEPPPVSRRGFLSGLGVVVGSTMLPGAADAAGAPATASTTASTTASFVVDNVSAGRGMPLVGYNTGHYLPGSNTSAWLAYSRVNAVRFFASLSEWTPDEAFDQGAGVADIGDFDARKADLRADPEHNPYIRWDVLEDLFEHHVYSTTNYYRLNYQVAELRRLGVTPIMEAAELKWNRPWSGLWLQWQKHYAFTYHLARHYDVERFNFLNEPDHPGAASDIVDQQVYVRGLQIASDAIRCAIADVNARYAKQLRAIVQAPVITHASQSSGPAHMDSDVDSDHRDDVFGWGQISLLNLRTDYHGETVDHDIFDVFDTHQYNKTYEVYADEIDMMRAKMRSYTPTGVALPIVYSEFNRRNTSAFETSSDDLNSPTIYGDLARIWGTALAHQVEGMIAFKFENTMRANGIPYGTGFYYVADEGSYDVRGVTKAGEVNRLFAKGFAGDRRLLRMRSGVGDATPAAHDPVARSYHLWLPQDAGAPGGDVTLDLGAVPLARSGSQVIVEEVSNTHSGGIVEVVDVPSSKSISLHQPPTAVWLVTVTDGDSAARRDVGAFAGACAQEGAPSVSTLSVSRGAAQSAVSYLAFRPGRAPVRRAILDLHGSSDDGLPLTFTVHALGDTSWAGQPLTWDGAPFLDGSAVRATNVGQSVFPAGQATALGTPGRVRLDVTDAVRSVSGGSVSDGSVGFMLIREARLATDTADDGRIALFAPADAPDVALRPVLHVWA
jgi:hypothetical protein